MAKISLLEHTSKSFSEAIFAHLGKGKRHAQLIYNEWFKKGQVTGKNPAFKNAGVLFKEILELTDFSVPKVKSQLDEECTGKVLIETKDGLEIESVVLPMQAGWTLCISSQVGCKMGCAFCETGKMGLIRSLTPSEIVSQLFLARHVLKMPIRNIVFMGMGEPLDNFDAVLEAIAIFTDPQGFNVGPRRITVSTSGVVPKIYEWIERCSLPIHLAVSINGATDRVRSSLMPINKEYNLAALKEACSTFCHRRGEKILIEYILIEGRTDSLDDADALAAFLVGLPCTVNLIPYNPGRRGPFKPPCEESVKRFATRLKNLGFFTCVRGTKGQKIMAACGQLYRPKSLKNWPYSPKLAVYDAKNE